MERDDRLEEYRKSLISAWSYNDYNDWPIKVNTIMHIFLEEFSAEFIEDFNSLREKGVSKYDIGKAFGNPARLFRIIDPVIYGMKRNIKNLESQREFVLNMLDIVKTMKVGSEFNQNGVNEIFDNNQISGICQELNFVEANERNASIIQRLCGSMWAYTESIFFRAHDVTKEVHGPYSLPNNEQLLIREYYNLSPNFLWGNLDFIKYSKITVLIKYSKNLRMRVDAYNHLFIDKGHFVNDMVEYCVLCDGEEISIEQVSEIIEQSSKTVTGINSFVSKASWLELVNKYADIYWYRKSPLKGLKDEQWEVPECLRQKISLGKVNEKRKNNLTDRQIDFLIRTVI